MNRRSFLERSMVLTAGLLSVPAISNKANTIRKETAKEPHEFIFAAICSAARFGQIKAMLGPSAGIRLVRYTSARAIRKKVSAAWIARDYRHRQKHLIRLLAAGIPVLAEAPYLEEISDFDSLQKAACSTSVPAGIALYHRFLPACISARELLSAGRIGKLTSVQVQINQPERDPLLPSYSFLPEAPLLVLLNLLQWLLSQPLLAMRVGRKETATPASAVSNGMSMGAMEDFPVRITTVPNFYENSSAWSMLFIGEKGQIRLGANNLLEIIDTSGAWQRQSGEDLNKASLSIRMCFEDFALAVKEGRQPEGKTTDMLPDCLLLNAMHQSLQTGKGELLVELPFGKAIRL